MPRTSRLSQDQRRRRLTEHMRLRRNDPELREHEQATDTQARRNSREDASYRANEQLVQTRFRQQRTTNTSSQDSSISEPVPLWSPHAQQELHANLSSREGDSHIVPEVQNNHPENTSDSEPEDVAPPHELTPQNNPWWIAVPYSSVRQVRHVWNRNCPHCDVPILTSKPRNICCMSGSKVLPRLPLLPQQLSDVFSRQDFSHKSRQLNSLFSFSSIGVDGSFVHFPAGVSSIALQGRTYHRILPGNTLTSPLRWFLYDSHARLEAAAQQSISPELVASVLASLTEINPFIHSLQRLSLYSNPNAILELNTTTAGNEIAAIIHTDSTTGIGPRSIAIHYFTDEQPTFVNSLHPLYESLQYPLFFPHGTPGWTITHSFSQIWYYRLRILQEQRFQQAGRLTNEYLVDMYSRVEEERLNYLRFNQPRAGGDEAVDAEGGPVAGQIYLPSTFLCGARWQAVQTADALAIVSRYGKPTFFITFTTNPNWPEIRSQMGQNQNFADKPFVVVRAFHQRLKKLKDFLRKKMGPVIYLIHVVEFQKRGLPHAHIAVKLAVEPLTPDEIDRVVLAEVPQEEGRLKDLVLNHMVHKHTVRFKTAHGGCQYHYPKELKDITTLDERGYVHYRRRTEEDINIVPYNPHLLLLLESHINVEIANSVNLIMYLYKYMYKGSDMTSVMVTVTEEENPDAVDEIKDYVKCRYLSAPEAAWRIMAYHMTEKEPAVKCLKVHLPEKPFTFDRNGLSQLERYFLRPAYDPFLSMTFIEYYEQCTFAIAPTTEDDNEIHLEIQKEGHSRQQVRLRKRGVCVGRLQMLYPSAGEVYYLRLLLAHRTATSFEDLRKIDGIQHATFQEAAIALGIFVDSNEGFLCFSEARDNLYSPFQLRILFCELVLDGSPAIPLWTSFQVDMMQDILEDLHNEELAINRVLEFICRYIEEREHKMTDFGLPEPAVHTLEAQLELERWNINPDHQLLASAEMYSQMNEAQQEVYNIVMQAVNQNASLVLFIDGKAGRGKTYLLQAVLKAVRSRNIIAIPVGTTALAASNYDGGRTAHSLFRIPVEENSELLISSVKHLTERWKLLAEAQVFVWDEFPMVNKAAFLCAENLMQNVMNQEAIFGGKIFIALGDFRQIAPVVKRGGRQAIVFASVRTLPIWVDFQIKRLTQPIRDAADPEYSTFVDAIGEGSSGENVDISILKSGSEDEVIEFVYPEEVLMNPSICVTRSILCPLNVSVDRMNLKILNKLPGEEWTLYSTDSLKEKSADGIVNHNTPFASIDFLNSQNPPGIPHHVLKIKVGSICNIMRNLSQANGLCRNTRVIIRNITRRYVQVEKVSASSQHPQLFLLPRMDFFFDLPYTPWKIHRKQFPLRLSYCNTFNSAQGLTLVRVGFDLRVPVFCHGQLYTGLTRIRGRESGMVIVSEPVFRSGDVLKTKNIVYPELLI